MRISNFELGIEMELPGASLSACENKGLNRFRSKEAGGMPVWVPATAGGPIDDGSRLELVVIVGGDLAVFMAVEDGSETEGSAEDFVEAEVKTTLGFFNYCQNTG